MRLSAFLRFWSPLDAIGVDALILADLAAFTLAKRYAPHCERHMSTQVWIANYVTARAWFDLGAARVVFARELSLDEIREIRQKSPKELEIETFCPRRDVRVAIPAGACFPTT